MDKELRKIPIFSKLSDSTINKLEDLIVKKEIKKGEILFFERQKVTNIYILSKGTVFLYRDGLKDYRRIVFILGEGKVINEVIFDGQTASITCEAFENSIIYSFDVEKLKNIMRDDFDLSFAFLTSTGHKVRKLYRQLKNATPIGLDKKLAAKLWKLSDGFGVDCYARNLSCTKKNENCIGWSHIIKSITITFLAEMLGSTRESISREMKKLEKAGLIKWENKHLLVKRCDLLEYYKGDKN